MDPRNDVVGIATRTVRFRSFVLLDPLERLLAVGSKATCILFHYHFCYLTLIRCRVHN